MFPAAVLSFPSVVPLFPIPETPSAELSFPMQKSLDPVSVMVLFQESESQAQVFLWSDSLSSLSPVQQD